MGQQKRSLHLEKYLRKVFIGDYDDDEGSVGVGGGSYGDGGANGGANGGGGSDKGGDGDGGGDYGDGATPLVTAIRGSPSPLSHRTGCCSVGGVKK